MICCLEEKMNWLEELKILTGIGKPDSQYVREEIQKCGTRLPALYSERKMLPDPAREEQKALQMMVSERVSGILVRKL